MCCSAGLGSTPPCARCSLPVEPSAAWRLRFSIGLNCWTGRSAAPTSCPAANNSASEARALIQAPNTILADEPVASLDPATASRVLELIHRICRQDGITAIVSLHQYELARRFADRVIALSTGRVVFDGSISELDRSALQRIYTTDSPDLLSPTSKTIPPQVEKEHRHETPPSSVSSGRSNVRHHRHRRSGAG